jgi:GT2 family glycosyltransferase
LQDCSEAGIVSAFVANDPNMVAKINKLSAKQSCVIFEVDGCGAACTAIRKELFDIEWPIPSLTYAYEDAAFHEQVKKRGYKILVDTDVTAIHLPHIVWLDPEAEKAKLHNRHVATNCSEDQFQASYDRSYSQVLNRWIKK